MAFSFLQISTDINKAQDLGESPHATLRLTQQIQLLPFDPQPYLQATNSKVPLSVNNDYSVFLVKCNDLTEVDVTDHVFIRNFESQLVIKLAYLPYDFNTTPVYLKIDRGTTGSAQNIYYSNKFLLTRHNESLTSRIDYKERDRIITDPNTETLSGLFQSIRLQFYFDNIVDATDIETYYQITTSQTVTPRVSVKEYYKWKTQLFNGWALSRLAQALYDGRCYINQIRNYIVEGFERAEREGMSNFSENEFLTDPDENDTINIIPLIIGDDWQTIPFLASSDQLASSEFLISQEFITIPL